jgi:hypothetical protein
MIAGRVNHLSYAVKARIFEIILKQVLWSDQKRRSCTEMSECIFFLALEAVSTAKASLEPSD